MKLNNDESKSNAMVIELMKAVSVVMLLGAVIWGFLIGPVFACNETAMKVLLVYAPFIFMLAVSLYFGVRSKTD